MKKKVLVSWSSGKDSAWTLHVLRQQDEVEVVGLLTTINEKFKRVAMHGTRRELLEAQAAAAKIPLWNVPLPWPCSNEQYEQAMAATCEKARKQGIEAIAFGDLFLEDVRKYREERMKNSGLEPLFPIWGRNTHKLLLEMLDEGLKSRIVCINPTQVSPDFAGKDLDRNLLAKFPANVDPCGENGEFHTFTYAGPMFRTPIPIESGEVITRDSFMYADVKLARKNAPVSSLCSLDVITNSQSPVKPKTVLKLR